MQAKRVFMKLNRTPEQIAEEKRVREYFQKNRRTPEELLASGEYVETVPLGQYIEMRKALASLRKEREKAGLSLSQVAERSGIDKDDLNRLESGRQTNPTLETLFRYAGALGKTIVFNFTNAPLPAAK